MTIGSYAEHAPTLLVVSSIVFTLLFALPMVLKPLSWGRAMRFTIPAETDLAVYFGRCLGSLALVLNAVALRAAVTGVGMTLVFEISIAFAVLMVLVHVYGAVKQIQPITETVEIAFWILVVALYVLCFPAAAAS